MREVLQFAAKNTTDDSKSFPKPTGHELPMAAAIKNRWMMRFELMDDTTVYGSVSAFDRWTVTVYLEGSGHPITYFKHALKSFSRA
ncbi:MAG TPA: hypothetical protein PKY22_13295 [Accumulibacter sp.]|nr:hypothetical protein [Accumulibacter sp.]